MPTLSQEKVAEAVALKAHAANQLFQRESTDKKTRPTVFNGVKYGARSECN